MRGFLIFLTDFADLATILPLAVAVALCLAGIGWRRGALAWLAAVPGSLATALLLKILILSHPGLLGGGSLRNPSGHATAAAVVYGGLVALFAGSLAWRMAVGLLAAAGAGLLIGLTRVLLGWHSVPDVLMGAAVGIGGVVALARLAGPRPPQARMFGLVIVLVAVVMAFHGHRLAAEETIRLIAEQISPR